ncbi:ATP-binding protein [Flavobacterium sp. ACN6]|uniref:PAS domain-containing sensor histidine kinase n=1 Tax=Flavobacterium sp. ACN6 TaxID=1920426 RepID=UPI000BB307BE|nr:ATP-binding protein [Flavobacterium sp. ACN6]PBJ07985.1 Phytochrome-like protein cph1 [Flavobacterium sp. ACN6]
MQYDIRLLQDIVENTPLPIAVYSGDNLTIEMANTAMINTWGKGPNIIGKQYLEVLPEIKDDVFFQQVLTVLKTGIPFHGHNKKVDLVVDGILKTYYFNYSFIPLKDQQGTVYGVMNTGTDVTELHTAKQQVQCAKERLQIAIESSGIGMYEIDLESKKIITCRNFNSICSIDSDIAHQELIARLHPEDLPIREKAHQEAEITGKISYEARIVNEDQSISWIKIDGKIIKNEQDIPSTIIGIIQDISEQRQFQQELQRQVAYSTEELKRSNDDLLHFASVVSHDLREPVRKIKIFNTLLRNEKNTHFNDKSINYLNKIDHASLRMNNIIEGILSYSTIDKSKTSIQNIDLNAIIESIKTDLELIIKEKGALLIANDLPEIQGAPILITQLFYNLLQNALKFSKADQPPRVIISCSKSEINGENAVQIIIKDNGIGMDPAFSEKIFTAFERLNSKDQYEGNGLGLSLCRKIVKRHHGTITAYGEKDNGAVFTVTLPIKQNAESI